MEVRESSEYAQQLDKLSVIMEVARTRQVCPFKALALCMISCMQREVYHVERDSQVDLRVKSVHG